MQLYVSRLDSLGRGGGGWRGEQRHVEVPAVGPDAGDLGGDGDDEAESARAVGEGSDGTGAPLHLAVEAFEAVRRADARPVLLRERVELRAGGEAVFEAGECFGDLRAEAGAEDREALPRLVEVGRIEHGAHRSRHAGAESLGRLRENVPFEVHRAALERHLGEELPDGVREVISDNYFCRLTTTTFGPAVRPACETVPQRAPDWCRGAQESPGWSRTGRSAC